MSTPSFRRVILLPLLWLGLAAMLSAQSVRVIARIGSGPVTYVAPGGATLDATPDTLVPEKSRITTAADVELYLEVLPGIIAVVRSHTQFVPERIVPGAGGENAGGARQALLNVEQGEVVFLVPAAGGNSTLFAVRTPNGGLARARSGVFAVRNSGSDGAVVAAFGEVEVTSRGSALTTLRGGQLAGSHVVFVGGSRKESLDPVWRGHVRDLAGAALTASAMVAGDRRLFAAGTAKAAADALPASLSLFFQAATASSPPALEEIGTTLEQVAERSRGNWIMLAGMTMKAMPPGALEACINKVAESLARGGVAAEPAAGSEVTGTLLRAFQVADPQRFNQLRLRLAMHITLGNIDGEIRRMAAGKAPGDPAAAAPEIAARSLNVALNTLHQLDPKIIHDSGFVLTLMTQLGSAVADALDVVLKRRSGTSAPLDKRVIERIVASLMNVRPQWAASLMASVQASASAVNSVGLANSPIFVFVPTTPIDVAVNVSPSN